MCFTSKIIRLSVYHRSLSLGSSRRGSVRVESKGRSFISCINDRVFIYRSNIKNLRLETCKLRSYLFLSRKGLGTNTDKIRVGITAEARQREMMSLTTQNLQNVINARDLSLATADIAPGRILRSGNPANGTLQDALLLRNEMGIRQMLDFRSSEEHAEDKGWSLMLSNGTIKTYDVNGDLSEVEIDHHNELAEASLPSCELHRLSLLERDRFVKALILRLPTLKVLGAFAYKLLGWHEEMRGLLVPEINQGGLVLIYKILLDTAAADINRALRIVVSAAESRQPLLIFCKLGKDRTGIMSALILYCCGASDEEIIEDYTKSDGIDKVALGGLEKMEDTKGMDQKLFASAPRKAILETLQYINGRWGSIGYYLDSIGFHKDLQKRLSVALSPKTRW